MAKVELSEEILTELFTTGKTKKKVTGFTSKAGNVFDTCLKFENDQISFDFDNPGEEEVQSTAEVHNNADAQSTADDAPDETTLNEMGIPEEFLAGFDMAADSAPVSYTHLYYCGCVFSKEQRDREIAARG